MATVTIPLSGRLPRVCLVCGSHNARSRPVTIPPSVTPRFGIPLAFGRGYTVLRMSLPLCARHGGEFFPQVLLRWLLALGTVGVPLVIIGVGLLLHAEWIVAVAIGAALVVPVLYFITSSLVNRGRVHPIGFDSDDGVTLDNVSPDFVRAMKSPPPGVGRDPIGVGTGGSVLWVLLGCGGAVAAVLMGGWLLAVLIGLRDMGKGKPQAGNRTNVSPITTKPLPPSGSTSTEPPAPEKVTLADIAAMKPDPLPIDPAWKDEDMEKTHLSDLPEFDVVHGWGKYGNNGMMGYLVWDPNPTRGNDPILVKGQRYPKGVSFTAPLESVGRARYRIGGDKKLLRGTVALCDMPARAGVKESETPGVFAVLGDDRLLWKSRPIHQIGESEDFRVSVEGVKVLELRVFKPGTKGHGLTVWPEVTALK